MPHNIGEPKHLEPWWLFGVVDRSSSLWSGDDLVFRGQGDPFLNLDC
jgi:hypothetical protein